MKRNPWLVFFIGFTVLAVLGLIVKESFSGQGTLAYVDQFEEIAFYRNENNTGPVVRIYAYRALDTDPEAMKSFASLLPHTKYGRTKVFFFDSSLSDSLVLSPVFPHFSEQYQPLLLAEYEKTPMGEQRFERRQP